MASEKKKQKPRLKPPTERAEHDTYETPSWCVDMLLKIIPIREDWKYLEPCRASGRIWNRMPIGSAWGEIREGVDYLKTDYPHVDCVITNPPFNLAVDFVEKAHKDADVSIMLMRLGFMGAIKRFEFWKEHKPTAIITMSKRPSFTEDGHTDGTDYCWYVFDRQNRLGLKEPFYWITDEEVA